MPSLIRDRAGYSPQMLAVFGDETLLRFALDFEAALALAQAEAGLIGAADAKAIANACRDLPDIGAVADAAAHAGALAIPLVKLLRERLGDDTAALVHRGSTSQDLADTALMLQAKAGAVLILAETDRLTGALAALAEAHAKTPMLGRTLIQGALPITLGLKVSVWLQGVAGAAARFERETAAIRLQLGGATGSRAAMGGKGAAVAAFMAARLGLADALPWQSERQGLAGLGAALAILTGGVGKIAGDIALLAQNEVAEAFEPRSEGRGGSSAMAHKRNPTGCQVAASAAIRAPHLAASLMSGLPQEHERSLGGWQAEAPVLAELFQLAHGALAAIAPVIEGLEVDTARMAANLDAVGVGHDAGESEAITRQALAQYRKDR